jgi:predicted O-linked N-acetylglucosamine transferase (SPINDLY family)
LRDDPVDLRATLSEGESHHKAGDLARAERAYRAVLGSERTNAHAWYLLGAVCLTTGRLEDAVACLREAIRLRPEHAATWNLLGVALGRQGRPADAAGCFGRALELQPGHAEAARNLERARHELAGSGTRGDRSGPVSSPDQPHESFEMCCGQAYALCEQNRYADAEPWLRRALALQPDSADLWNDLGKVLVLQARPDEGAACFGKAIAIDPVHGRAHLNLAATLFELNRLDEAEAAARKAAEIDPENPSTCNNLALILQRVGRLGESERSYREGLRLVPDHAELHANLGNVLVMQGRAAEAQSHYERAMQVKPDFASAHSNWLLSRQCLPGVNTAVLAEAHDEWEGLHARPLRSTWRSFANDRDPERPLRLGFVSRDFRHHPVGYFILRAVEGLRGLDCQTYCYDTSSTRDDLTGRFAAASHVWRHCRGRSDQELADQIRADGVDLLFDLAGHTSGNRLLLFARKPAPIQLTWLGYVGTTGLSAMDYLIADRYQVLEGTESHYREQVLRLPDGYVCYGPPAYAPDVAPLPAAERGHVTFGCFNSPAKVNPGVIAAWAEVLKDLPSSRLLLKYKGLDDERVRGRFLDLFAARGIGPDRVEIEGWSPNAEILAAYGRVDIALDTFPYTGCTTTCEALWMGVPVVTWPGETFAGRHSLSHLAAAGVTGTVARDLGGYLEIALGLAADLPRLAELRAGLRPRMASSPLCDGDRFARNLLHALRAAWREWCASQAN